MALLVLVGVSYGLSSFIPFLKTFSIASSLGILYILFQKNNESIDQILEGAVKTVNEEHAAVLDEYSKTIDEQYDTIKEYEAIFDSQVVEIPCGCGENSFVGIFVPNTENICTCEKCKSTYKIFISFDSILTTEPLEDLDFSKQLKTSE